MKIISQSKYMKMVTYLAIAFCLTGKRGKDDRSEIMRKGKIYACLAQAVCAIGGAKGMKDDFPRMVDAIKECLDE